MDIVFVKSSPSLALIKYWGKKREGKNIPATSSLAVTLNSLVTVTKIAPCSGQDSITIDGTSCHSEKMLCYLAYLKKKLQLKEAYAIESKNNFPKASGLASSSSGYAALAMGFTVFRKKEFTLRQLSSLAQSGSGSAARSIFGGFSIMKAGKDHAASLYGSDYWPEIRVIVCMVTKNEKEHSSSDAMNSVRDSSVFYNSWLESSEKIFKTGLEAIKSKDIKALGEAMQLSYKQMFATMLGANPPILYWLPQSLEIMRLCSTLRSQGIGAWETMDAGPQVKILCLASQITDILDPLKTLIGEDQIVITKAGAGTRLIDESEYQISGE